MLTRELSQVVRTEVDGAVARLEHDRRLRVPSVVGRLLIELLYESLRSREDEWRSQHQFDFRFGENSEQLTSFLPSLLDGVLGGAAELPQYQDGPIPSLAVISVIEWLHDNWCGIYPLCRPRGTDV